MPGEGSGAPGAGPTSCAISRRSWRKRSPMRVRSGLAHDSARSRASADARDEVVPLGEFEAEIDQQPVGAGQGDCQCWSCPSLPGSSMVSSASTASLSAWKTRSMRSIASGPPYRSTSRS